MTKTLEEIADYVFSCLELTEDLSKEFIKQNLLNIKLFDHKQSDYGSGNIAAFGEEGVLVRTSDKLERLKNLKKHGTNPNNESVNDTWQDISIYAIIALLCRNGKWK